MEDATYLCHHMETGTQAYHQEVSQLDFQEVYLCAQDNTTTRQCLLCSWQVGATREAQFQREDMVTAIFPCRHGRLAIPKR